MLRIATFNIWGRFADWPRRRALMREQLPPLDIDVYLLQEVVFCGDGRGDQPLEFAGLLGFAWTAGVIAESRPHETEDEGVAIVSRAPLHATDARPLPPSHPPRHRLEASIEWDDTTIRLMTLHAAVSPHEGRDEQIAALADLRANPLVLGSDSNAPPSFVRPLLGRSFADTLGWSEQPTWPVDADAFVDAWEAKIGEKPKGDPDPRRLDYLLCRGVRVVGSGTLAIGDGRHSASDHLLVWADVSMPLPGPAACITYHVWLERTERKFSPRAES